MHIGIVGAGICGLMAAQQLEAAGFQVSLFDKGRSVGGRLATRRIGNGRADHGAQFFTVRSPAFQTHVDEWCNDGIVYVWSHGWDNLEDGHPRYAVVDGMNRLAKYLAQKLQATIYTDCRIESVSLSEDRWHLRDSVQTIFAFDAVVLTSPVGQSLELLDAGRVKLEPQDRTHLERIRYAPCLCILVRLAGETHLPVGGARQTPDEVITWVADNQAKGISPAEKILTIHASPAFSETHWRKPDAEVLQAIQPYMESLFGPKTQILEQQVKWWRYAQPLVVHPEPYVAASLPQPLLFGGDAFGSPRVEGAALSGLAIAETFRENRFQP